MFGGNKASKLVIQGGCKRDCRLGRRRESAIYIMTVVVKEGKVVIAGS